MRIGTSGLLAGMAALLLGAARASAEAAEEKPQGEGGPEAAPAESAPGEISGAVKKASPEGVRVSVRGAPDVQLNMKPRTIVVVNGQMANVSDIQEGDKVRALYRDVQGQPMAIMLEVTGPERPPPERFE
jgi:Cu/Ag efflux protein CusF